MRRPGFRHAVDERINCSDIKNGFAEYICEDCGEITKVLFTCKSKFCKFADMDNYCNVEYDECYPF